MGDIRKGDGLFVSTTQMKHTVVLCSLCLKITVPKIGFGTSTKILNIQLWLVCKLLCQFKGLQSRQNYEDSPGTAKFLRYLVSAGRFGAKMAPASHLVTKPQGCTCTFGMTSPSFPQMFEGFPKTMVLNLHFSGGTSGKG